MPLSQIRLLSSSCTAAQRCTNGTVRLVDGPVESAGRVEICINGVWGRVYSGLDGNYSRVVCRQLGYNVDAGEGELNHALGRGLVIIAIGVRGYLYTTVECKCYLAMVLGL